MCVLSNGKICKEITGFIQNNNNSYTPRNFDDVFLEYKKRITQGNFS